MEPDGPDPTGSPGKPSGSPAEGENKPDDPAPDASVTASRTFLRMRRSTLQGTGFLKPLSGTGRIGRFVSALGLMLGRRLAIVVRDDHIYVVLMAAVVGVTSGAAAGLLLLWIDYAIDLFPRAIEAVAVSVLVLVPVIGGLVAGGLRMFSQRVLDERPIIGPAGVLGAIAQRGGLLSGRSATVAGIGTGVSIGSGGSCGHEGPSVAIGAAVGSVVARFFGLRLRRQVAMVGAGCAGGLAAAFNAPLAGVIFTVELVFGGAIGGNVGTMSVFIPLIVAAVAGTFTSHAIFGPRTEFQLAVHEAPGLGDFGFYLLLALVAGVLGAFLSRAMLWARHRFDKVKGPVWLRPAIGGLGVGILASGIGLLVTDVGGQNPLLGPGRSVVAAALHGELVWHLALVLIGLKIVVTGLTLGSGGFGGVFMPSLYIGACLGVLVGTVAGLVLGSGAQDPSAYALVGMGGVFAGMMLAPLTPIVMIFELTHDYAIILPLMFTCILAVAVARRINRESFYKMQLRDEGVMLKDEAEGDVLKRGQVSELLVPADRMLTKGAPLDEVRKVCLHANLDAIFVTDENGAVAGYIDGTQLARRMLRGEIKDGSTAGELMGKSKLTLLYPDDSLAGAMLAFARSGQEILPVVDRERRLQGVIRRGDLISHYSDKVLGEQEEIVQVSGGDAVDQEVGLGKGVILERVIVGRAWAGRSLAELDLRGRHGVVLLEWRRGEQVMQIDPRAPLREGDVVALAGSRDALLHAREIW